MSPLLSEYRRQPRVVLTQIPSSLQGPRRHWQTPDAVEQDGLFLFSLERMYLLANASGPNDLNIPNKQKEGLHICQVRSAFLAFLHWPGYRSAPSFMDRALEPTHWVRPRLALQPRPLKSTCFMKWHCHKIEQHTCNVLQTPCSNLQSMFAKQCIHEYIYIYSILCKHRKCSLSHEALFSYASRCLSICFDSTNNTKLTNNIK